MQIEGVTAVYRPLFSFINIGQRGRNYDDVNNVYS